jgi:hypothetical protein
LHLWTFTPYIVLERRNDSYCGRGSTRTLRVVSGSLWVTATLT